VEVEAIIQTQQMVIIILVQDVIMDIATVLMQVLGQALIQTEIQIHRRSKQRRGGIIVIQVRLQHLHHQIVVHRLLTVVHQVVVLHLAEVRRAVAAVVEVEVQDKINKTLTSKIPSKRTFEGIFSFKV
jgi:hypothetical protein